MTIKLAVGSSDYEGAIEQANRELNTLQHELDRINGDPPNPEEDDPLDDPMWDSPEEVPLDKPVVQEIIIYEPVPDELVPPED